MTGHRAAPSAQLLRVGAGNIVAGLIGAIPSGINLSSTFALYRAGGRGALAPLVCALFVLAATLGLGSVIGLIPRVVIAGVLVIVALQLSDHATLQRLLRLFRERDEHWRVPALDLLVVALVAVVTIALDLVWAVSVGVAAAILLFLYRVSRSIVRRTYRGDAVRSKRMLDRRLTEFLAEAGRRIVVFELEGPISSAPLKSSRDRSRRRRRRTPRSSSSTCAASTSSTAPARPCSCKPRGACAAMAGICC